MPLRKEACRAFADQDEAALFASYAEMFKKSEAMLSEFPARQECRTASGDMDTFDLANREDAEGYIRMGVQESYQLLRPRMIAVCPSSPSAEAAVDRASSQNAKLAAVSENLDREVHAVRGLPVVRVVH